jgi:hypothetical protein
LLAAGADPGAAGFNAETSLHRAAQNPSGQAAVVAIQALVQAGADARARDAFGRTPLHAVACNPVPEAAVAAARALLDAGASVHDTDSEGMAPLHYAAAEEEGVPSLAELLLAAGADPAAMDRRGRLASPVAARLAAVRLAPPAAPARQGLRMAPSTAARRLLDVSAGSDAVAPGGGATSRQAVPESGQGVAVVRLSDATADISIQASDKKG